MKNIIFVATLLFAFSSCVHTSLDTTQTLFSGDDITGEWRHIQDITSDTAIEYGVSSYTLLVDGYGAVQRKNSKFKSLDFSGTYLYDEKENKFTFVLASGETADYEVTKLTSKRLYLTQGEGDDLRTMVFAR